ncbi:MAG: hypothetical protein A3D28_05490 [Omnitrophica bacterium RIFCSPHIGHO2_02_FULL_63_14]|nr:MAG: hypothetical protein A3D28_05490 [Omnitrophica bacterium RIFCSPHIGHO2_02_FULL_63_14]
MNCPIRTLDNGVRVVAAPLKERRSTAIGVWVHTGARDEDARTSGVSHFLEHVVFKGTKRRTAAEIKEGVEGLGGSLNAFTSEEYTCFLAKCTSRHFEKVFDVLADMVLNASLQEKDIRKERTVILEEIKMTQDQPSQWVDELVAELTWEGHALARPVAGSMQSVSGLTTDDIRSYKDAHYRSGFLTIAAAGAIGIESLLKEAARRFDRAKPGTRRPLDLFQNRQTAPRLKLCHKPVEQTHMALSIHALPHEHPDQYVLDLLSVILGGNMSSRLFCEVREKRGLAYEVGSSVRKYHETGAFGVDAGVDSRKAVESLKVILAELRKTAVRPVSEGELRRAKDFYLGQLDMGLENTMSQMLWVGESVVRLGRCRRPEEVARAVAKVRREDLRRVAAAVFQTRALNLAIVGPGVDRSQKAFRKALAF